MSPLFLKDLRLSLDAVLPWLMVVAGFGVVILFLGAMSRTALPAGLQILSPLEIIATVGGVAGFSIGVVSAWIAAVVALGDRRHGAGSLAIALPIASGGRIAAKLMAILLATALVAFVAVVLRAIAGDPSVPAKAILGLQPGVVAVVALVGAAFAMAVAPLARGVFSAVMIAILVAIVAGGVALIGSAIVFPFAAREDIAIALAADQSFWIDEIRMRVMSVATITGIIAAAAVCALLGALLIARPRSSQSIALGLATLFVVALLAGAGATFVSVARDPFRTSSTYTDRWLYLSDDESMVAAIGRFGKELQSYKSFENRLLQAMSERGPDNWALLDDVRMASSNSDWRLVRRARDRVQLMPPSARNDSVFAQALRDAEDQSTWITAVISLQLIPVDDPRRLSAALDTVIRYPEIPNIRRVLDLPVARALGLQPESRQTPQSIEPLTPFASHELDSVLAGRLRTLQTLDAHAADHDAMRRVIEAIESAQ